MLFRKSAILFLLFTCMCVGQLFAAHIVGGDFSYRHISGDTYELKLKMFRDCGANGAGFEQSLSIGIFDKQLIPASKTLRYLELLFIQSYIIPLVLIHNYVV